MRSSRARRVEVPESIRSREDLAGANRALTYELPVENATSMTPEQRARGTLEESPTLARWILVLGLKFTLGLKLGDRSSPDHVLGWPMSENPPDTVTLATDSWLVAAHHVATVRDSSVVWTTLVQYKKGLARPIWRFVELPHMILMPYVLGHARRAHADVLSRAAPA
jgi:hypothetical protein